MPINPYTNSSYPQPGPELPQMVSYGHELDMSYDKIGEMRDSSDIINNSVELRRRYNDSGYLYIKGFFEREEVLNVRAALLEKIDGEGFKPEVAKECEPLQKLLYTGKIMDFYKLFFGEPVRHYDYTWLRAIGPGKGTNPHCDLPYMGRGTHNQMTCWVPYGDVPYELGGLMILEKSHKRLDILKKYAYRDVDVYCKNKKEDLAKVENGEWVFSGTLSHNPPAIRNKFGHKWLVADYKAGDLLTFNMLTVHAALDNRVPDSLRLSSDSRYQKASEPIDERWVGENPPGHGPDGKVGLIC